MPIIATQRIPYGKKRYEVGEEIPASEKDAKLLVAIGKARRSDAGSPTDLPASVMQAGEKAPEPVDLAPEPAADGEAAPEAPADPRTDTRDIAAAGPTGQVRQSQSSRPGRRSNRKS
jgi:hypothetical protein